ncbi:uroporphyrinogen decarboxylase family protein [Christensenella tenuis]|uniref:Thioredoxin family protein n=1 Tax=Christensenella tenuis TaxID=2763033 RepID=A0ABR7EGW7_9FIRM|nr:uroporphyrinogen decarboxylase family protein [Christensenella tenuis]MBC5648279.1 thioredoxin family protein [Christensenella tenuis]
MNSKELVMNAIHNKEVERTPWVPFVGCHAAKLIGVTATEFFRSADLIYDGVMKAYEEYNPDGLPALFDLQIEAEALGCELQYADTNPPSVQTHILEQGKTLDDLKIPTEKDGRFPVALESLRRIVASLGDKIAIYGLITGPFTLALHLKGTDIFFAMYDNPEETHKLMRFCTDVAKHTAKMYMDAGADIIAVVDPMTSQISPDTFHEFVTPYCTEIFEYIRENGKAGSFFVCGNAKNNIEEMCSCKPENVSIDENIPLDYVRDVCREHGISFGGNIKLTLTILFGSPTDNIQDAQNCMAIGGNKGFILAPGCDIPFDAPAENLKAVTSVVHGNISDIVEDESALAGVEYELPDYANEKQVIMDVITLDSESCAPCQYMMEAVRTAADPYGDKVKYIEHKIKDKESVVCMMKLGVQNIPTICIDGDVKYVSIIPDYQELSDVIGEYVSRKEK